MKTLVTEVLAGEVVELDVPVSHFIVSLLAFNQCLDNVVSEKDSG